MCSSKTDLSWLARTETVMFPNFGILRRWSGKEGNFSHHDKLTRRSQAFDPCKSTPLSHTIASEEMALTTVSFGDGYEIAPLLVMKT